MKKEQKPRLTPAQRILDGLSILICICAVVYIAVTYKRLPEQIASHFDAHGNITGYQGKSMLILLAFFMVFLITLPMSLLVRIRKLYTVINTPWPIPKGQEGRVAELTKDFLCITNLAMSLMFAYLIVCCAQSRNPGVFVWLPILAMAAALAALLIKTRNACKNPKDKEPWET
jgi:uncharacterized membrane protein